MQTVCIAIDLLAILHLAEYVWLIQRIAVPVSSACTHCTIGWHGY
jgi:hypothetical protein